MAITNGVPILDETNLRVGDMFSLFMPRLIQGIPVNHTIRSIMLVDINWDSRSALTVSLDTGRFIEVPLRFLIRFRGPLTNRQMANRRSFFDGQSIVRLEPQGTLIQPPPNHAAVFEVLAIEDDRRAAHAGRPDIPRYINRGNYHESNFADHFLF